MQSLFSDGCKYADNIDLCEYKAKEVKKYEHTPIKNYKASWEPKLIDSCENEQCLGRGHTFDALEPVLEAFEVNELAGDNKTKLFSDEGRMQLTAPLKEFPLAQIPGEGLAYLDMTLEVESLAQIRRARLEATESISKAGLTLQWEQYSYCVC